jgi:predicted nucleic acid-binding protein
VRKHEDWRIFTTHVLLDELADVLSRSLSTKRLGLIDCTAHQVLADYIRAVDFVTPRATPRVIEADPDDDHVIAAAAANADLITSGDRQ